jgi:hypothetical protein
MRSAGYATKGTRIIFFWGREGGVGFFCCSHQVLNIFPSHRQINFLSQHVPQDPNVFPRAATFVQYALPSCLLGSYIGELILKLICFYVWSEYFYIEGVPQVS